MADLPSPAFASVIFDLDGTLIDSSEDIARALNKAIASYGAGGVTQQHVAQALGGGPRILVEKCLAAANITVTDAQLEDILRDYSRNYMAAPAERTRLLDTAGPVIRRLHDRGIAIGVCTNKRTAIAVEVLRALGLTDLIGAVIGTDATSAPKPHPQHLIDTAAALHVSPASVLYVGDTAIDRHTAAAAGVTYAHVAWGEPGSPSDIRLGSFDDLLAIV